MPDPSTPTGTPSAPPPTTSTGTPSAPPPATRPADAEPVPVPGKPVSAEPVAARPVTAPGPPTGSGRAVLIADTALALLAERGMRGLTHRAVDEAAGLPPGSTSNHARTRLALLEAANERLATREARALAVTELPDPAGGPDAVADALAPVLHGYLTGHRELLVCRYELALEATRRPELRHRYDEAGRRFREPLLALVTALGSPDPRRHTLSLIAWSDGMMFACVAGSHHAEVPTPDQLRDGLRELLTGMVGAGPPDDRR
ncbi:TetR/AcrR family transcriptional regulator [Streptomyces uncialis]|uniref:TetR/AcrR family transcriptional regulator n=1 Tax=Streptomyces uncialis TaxID=1048205 RepID=UPI00386F9EBB|nr:TetR family transcriptional regulator C-terminal domain-containing protein [Streptomyces uncialis]